MKKRVLITGVAGGIGSAAARMFSSLAWDIVGMDVKPTADVNVDFLNVDFAAADHLELILDRLPTGSFDCIVNNAGVLLPAPIRDASLDDWEHVVAVNLRCPFQLMRRAPSLLAQHGASIVNVGSIHSLVTSTGKGSYAASKAGLVALTRVGALEMAPLNIRVNAVLPGAITTSMLPEQHRERIRSRTPLKRLGTPEDVAQAILFLADSERSGFITGQSVIVDGGASTQLATE